MQLSLKRVRLRRRLSLADFERDTGQRWRDEPDFSQGKSRQGSCRGHNLNKSTQAGGVWPSREVWGWSSDCGVIWEMRAERKESTRRKSL